MKKILTIISIISVIFSASSALAAVIVDTGTPTGVYAYSLASSQWLAGKFNLSTANTLTDVWGYIEPRWSGGTLTLAIYADGVNVPDITHELFSGAFLVDSDPNAPAPPDWHGLSGLNWDLPVGSYWTAFEVRSGQAFNGCMLGPAPSPLGHDAFDNGSGWYDADYLAFGLRINGTQGGQPVIPEPATMSLLGMGLLGLLGFKKKR